MSTTHLTAAEQREIARAHAVESAHKIAKRLDPPTSVKAEIRRLRRDAQTPPARVRTGHSQTVLVAAAVAMPVAIGVGLLLTDGPEAPLTTESTGANPTPRPQTEVVREPAVARHFDAKLDRNEAPDAGEVISRLESDEETIRLGAIRACEKFPPAERDPTPLLPLLNDPAQRVRLGTLQALGRLADDRAVSALVAIINAEQPGAEHQLAVNALGKRTTENRLGALTALLSHEAPRIRIEAFPALSRYSQTDLQSDFEQVQTVFQKHLDSRRRTS